MEEKYCINVTHLKNHAIIRLTTSGIVKYNIPNLRVFGKRLNQIYKGILNVEEELPAKKIYLCSSQNPGTIERKLSEEKLEKLCNQLNEGRNPETFEIKTNIKKNSN